MRSVFVCGLLLSVLGVKFLSADALYNVSIDTAPLVGHQAGPFALELQFVDGSGLGDANNKAVLNDFILGSGSPNGAPTVVNGATGNLNSSVTMADTSFFNEFVQTFTPGAVLSFRLDLTTNTDVGAVPDQFSLAILDSSGVEIPTQGSGNAFIIVNIVTQPLVSVFSSNSSTPPSAGGPPLNIPAPQVNPVLSNAAPEPRSKFLFAFGLIFVTLLERRRARTRLVR